MPVPLTRLRRAIASAALAVLPLTAAVPAAADTLPAPSVSATPQTPSTGAYASLSAALLGYSASQSNESLSAYLTQNQPQLSQTLGTGGGQLSASSVDALNQSLGAQGLLLDQSAFKDLSSAAQRIDADSSSPDSRVITAGTAWMQQIAALHAPTLTTPGMPSLNTSLATAYPKQGLQFGLFLDKSLTALVQDSPNVYKQVSASGITTPAQQQAWQSAMSKAYQATQSNISSLLPDPCSAAGLATMANGSPAKTAQLGIGTGSGCGGCVLTGLYEHNQLASLWNNSSSTVSGTGTNVSSQAAASLPDWLKKNLTAQNPTLVSSLYPSAQTSGATSVDACTAAASAATGLLNSNVLGSVLNGLNFSH